MPVKLGWPLEVRWIEPSPAHDPVRQGKLSRMAVRRYPYRFIFIPRVAVTFFRITSTDPPCTPKPGLYFHNVDET